MKNHYRIVAFKTLLVADLTPPPAAQLPMDDEDREALGDSIGERGVLQPLIVSAKPGPDGRHQIYEGVNRWRIHEDTDPDASLPCLLVECDDPRALALTFLGIGRKRSTGQRIMAYLEMHRKEVLKVAAITSDLDVRSKRLGSPAGHVTGREIPSNLVNFTAEAIAAKLHCSDKDVRLGIELLQCIENKTTGSWDRGSIHVPNKPLDLEKPDGRDYLDALKKVHLGLLAGSTPIRRWKPAAAGLAKTGAKPRNEPCYAVIMHRALRSAIASLKHWDTMPANLKQRLAADWEELREAAAKVHLD